MRYKNYVSSESWLESSDDVTTSCRSHDECHNNGTCVMTSVLRHRCVCRPRWTGDRCQTRVALTDTSETNYSHVNQTPVDMSCSADTCVHGVCAAPDHQSRVLRCFCVPGKWSVS